MSDKIKPDFFQAEAMSMLLCGYTIWTLTKCMKGTLDMNSTRMLLF